MENRVYNFSPGPAMLPLPVLKQAEQELLALPGVGMSVLEISHRSKPNLEIMAEADANLRELLSIPESFKILFLQGGSRLQFSMVPMNFLRGGDSPADYLLTGSWGKKALAEAKLEGPTHVVWDGNETNYDRLPDPTAIEWNPNAPYAHYTSNETIQGVQLPDTPGSGSVPLVCDASSDFLSRPIDVAQHGLIYACAQKNSGPAGVTVVAVRDDMLDRIPAGLHTMLDYRQHVKQNSLLNTPPVFAIYILMLVTRWLKNEMGGLEKMAALNEEKAKQIYDVIDSSEGFYRGHAQPDSRSVMNVTFRLPSDELDAAFVTAAQENGLCSLKGHRSVGGIRASIYNAMPVEGVETLRQFMTDFQQRNS